MSGDEYWQRIAAEQHAKLIEAREALARSRSTNHQHYAQVRDELLRACEAAREYIGAAGGPVAARVAKQLDAAISRAGGGG